MASNTTVPRGPALTSLEAADENDPTSPVSQSIDTTGGGSNSDIQGDSDRGGRASSEDDRPAASSGVRLHGWDSNSAVIPQWQREIAASRIGKRNRSRASSVISCQTRLTVSTDDARSVEFEAGGRAFRISRDGSNVSEITAPPPYPGPPLEQLPEESDEEDLELASARASTDTLRQPGSHGMEQIEHQPQSLPMQINQPDNGTESSSTAMRMSGVLELPQRLRSAIFSRWNAPTPTTPEADAKASTTERFLRRTQSDSSAHVRVLPPNAWLATNGYSDLTFLEAERQIPQDQNTYAITEPVDDQASDVSTHYTRMMRDLDRQHRHKLHERDEELARMRVLLDEKDKIMRQQMREKDFVLQTLRNELELKDQTINDLKKKNYEMEEDIEDRLEKARHEVEDNWERRWKEYERLIMDQADEVLATASSSGYATEASLHA